MNLARHWRGWGVQLEIRGPDSLLQALPDWIPPCGSFGEFSEPPGACFAWDEARHLWVRHPGQDIHLDLQSALALEVASRSPQYLFVHSGSLRFRGKALVLPGVSRAGKSTLVEALVRRGLDYYSDEYAVFQPDGLVTPYPRKLSLRPTSDNQEPKLVAAEQLGWRPEMEPVPLGWVVDCRYSERHYLQVISPGESLLSLFANAVAARSRAKALFHSLSKALVGVPALRGLRGEAEATADWLVEWMSA